MSLIAQKFKLNNEGKTIHYACIVEIKLKTFQKIKNNHISNTKKLLIKIRLYD